MDFRGQSILPAEEGVVLRDDVSGSEVKHVEERQRLDPARMGSIQSVAVLQLMGQRGWPMIGAVSPDIHGYSLDVAGVGQVAFSLAAYTAVMDRLWTPWRYAYVTGEEAGDGRRGVPPALAAWPGDTHCVFCNMIAAMDYAVEHGMTVEAAEEAAHILERGKNCFLVLNAYPYNGGHLMVVPYLHEASLAGLPLDVAEEMMRLARRTERVLRAVYQPEGINFGFNLGKAAGAGVAEHLHLHAVPRWGGDNNFMSVLAETRVLAEMLDESWRRIRAALAVDVVE